MLHKVFLILEAIAYKKLATIDSISAETKLPRSTVHRILQMLQREGVVMRHTRHGYTITPKLLSIGLYGIAEQDILDAAIPIMREISEATQETVSLNIGSGYERVCVYRIEGTQPITRNIRIGSKAPLFFGSAGKVIASGLSAKEREHVLDRYVAEGIISAEGVPGLIHDIEIVGQQGYAISIGERISGSASLAVPIKDALNHVVAALSISTLESRLTPENKKSYLDYLLNAAGRIEQEHFFLQ